MSTSSPGFASTLPGVKTSIIAGGESLNGGGAVAPGLAPWESLLMPWGPFAGL